MAHKLTRHHVPAKHPALSKYTKPEGRQHFILKKTEKQHRAYHLLFGNSPDLETCIEILKRDWWTPGKTPE